MRVSWLQPALLCALLVVGAAPFGCGDGSGDNSFPSNGGGDDGSGQNDDGGDDGNCPFGCGDDGSAAASLAITPSGPTVDVAITDGVVSTQPLQLTAVATGANGGTSNVKASWSFDRGELGSIDAAGGIFTASGNLGGQGTVTAHYQGLTATTPLTVRIHATQNGRPGGADAGPGDGGAGGIGGVGGEGLGGPVDNGTIGILTGKPQPPQNAQELGWLYPYDKTVWPRGILAPLLQWQTTHGSKAVYIHLTEKNYDFQGFYSGTALVHEPIDATAWQQATYGNGGDALHVEIVITDGSTAWGPIAEDWTIASGVLKGTVYYNSYNSKIVGGSTGAVLAIKPGATSPSIAVPGTGSSCHVCHEVSADGSTIIFQDGSYSNGASYDLTNNGKVISSYSGNAADGTSNNRKFLWSAVYPDGTFAMANANHAREHYSGQSLLFKRSDGTAIATSGWTNVVTSAVTPAFAENGRTIAFNFWDGFQANGISPGGGHNLVAMDFACGQPDGGTGCGNPPYTFSNLRQIYSNGSRWPGWPAFLPDGSGVVFHNTLVAGSCGDCELTTWNGSRAELWWSDVPPSSQKQASPVRLDMLDGFANSKSYLPTNGSHSDDTGYNYEPTVNPVASGGYFWVVFTSRRMYGNVAAGDPYDNGNGTYPIPKKLWVAAIDLSPKAGADPSHPAFYLPGQELNAGNMRGFWVVDPCKQNGTSCITGDECCGGYCTNVDGGFVCTNQPPPCSQEFDKCTSDSDCCNTQPPLKCINGRCAQGTQ